MPHYASDNYITSEPFEGCYELSDAEFQLAFDSMMNGAGFKIIDGVFVVGPFPDPEPETPPDPDPVAEALSALYQTDAVALRCYKAGIPFPEDWQAYTVTLRAIVNGSIDPLPVAPPFPDDAILYQA